jgi:hypothetical protein
VTGFVAAFTEAPIDFYKSQIQVQVIRSQSDPNYRGMPASNISPLPGFLDSRSSNKYVTVGDIAMPQLCVETDMFIVFNQTAEAWLDVLCSCIYQCWGVCEADVPAEWHEGPVPGIHTYPILDKIRYRLAWTPTDRVGHRNCSEIWCQGSPHGQVFCEDCVLPIRKASRLGVVPWAVNGHKALPACDTPLNMAGHLQGLFTTMVRNVPANAVYLGTFEVLKNRAATYKQISVPELPAGYVLGSAALGGILYWCTIYPVDVCKSAIMTVPLSTPSPFSNFLLRILCN